MNNHHQYFCELSFSNEWRYIIFGYKLIERKYIIFSLQVQDIGNIWDLHDYIMTPKLRLLLRIEIASEQYSMSYYNMLNNIRLSTHKIQIRHHVFHNILLAHYRDIICNIGILHFSRILKQKGTTQSMCTISGKCQILMGSNQCISRFIQANYR